jgi:methylated-DNA-[protein]-cysteine S-methyltransferase
MPSPTPFQKKVYTACSRIPKGKVASYATLADMSDCASPRAIGQALKKNPYAPAVPCHRVVKSDRRLGGFTGHSSGPEVERKRELLENEGVPFAPDGRVDPAGFWTG